MGIFKKITGEFILLILAIFLTGSVGLPAIASGVRALDAEISKSRSNGVDPVTNNVATDTDLNIMSGNDIIGMVPFAVQGEYTLVVDGITIQEGTNLDDISLSGVVGLRYQVSMDAQGTTITANRIP